MKPEEACGFNFETGYTTLPPQFFTELKPDLVNAPQLVLVNNELAEEMGLDFSSLSSSELAELFSGKRLPEGATPFSQAYAGHQFGHFTNLGDGRAHVLGEHVTPDGKRFDIQFKGSGRTPYSRRGDGKAVLGPMLREYIIAEAMYHLGIPTTRGLAVVTTGQPVRRETILPGAILTRVASSHIRVGTFEFAAAQGGREAVSALLDYTVSRHYPQVIAAENKALSLLEAVMERQADLIVHWMRVGFIHGVMNTDNMTLSGETIDYGPCAFMDAYDPDTVFSSIDRAGRYAFANQPKIAQWNLARFVETLLPHIDDDIEAAIGIAEEKITQFTDLYQDKWRAMMRSKLGLMGVQEGDEELITDLLSWMHENHADYTNTFYALSAADKPSGAPYCDKGFDAWFGRWRARLERNGESMETAFDLMKSVNPVVIPRNHKVEEALSAAHAGELAPFNDLLAALSRPYEDRESLEHFKEPPEPSDRVYQTFCGT